MDTVRNTEVHVWTGMAEKLVGVKCGFAEWVERNTGTLRWYGHVRKVPEDTMVKEVY